MSECYGDWCVFKDTLCLVDFPPAYRNSCQTADLIETTTEKLALKLFIEIYNKYGDDYFIDSKEYEIMTEIIESCLIYNNFNIDNFKAEEINRHLTKEKLESAIREIMTEHILDMAG